MKKNLRILSLLLALLMALCLTACTGVESPADGTDSAIGSSEVTNGEQKNTVTITVDVIGSDGKTTTFTIETASETLRGALEQESLVQGEDGPYGLYIKTVNGELADYDVNGAYWAVYQGDTAAMTGVDGIKIADGGHYKLVYTK